MDADPTPQKTTKKHVVICEDELKQYRQHWFGGTTIDTIPVRTKDTNSLGERNPPFKFSSHWRCGKYERSNTLSSLQTPIPRVSNSNSSCAQVLLHFSFAFRSKIVSNRTRIRKHRPSGCKLLLSYSIYVQRERTPTTNHAGAVHVPASSSWILIVNE